MLISTGMQPAAAGAYLGLATAIGIPSGFALAPLISKLKNLSWLAAGASAVTTSGFSVLAFILATDSADNAALLILASVLISVGQTATFPVSLSLVATRASTHAQTTVLSAFSQGWGYLISGFGTFAFGAMAAAFSSWTVVALTIAAISAVQIAIGFYAGRDSKIAA
jgi:CP family cyanate transporter-like MFS transporter